MADERPTGVTIVAILAFVFGALGILGGLLMIGGGSMMGAMYGQEAAFMAGYATFGGIVAIIYGVIEILVGWGLWTAKKWAWWITVIFSAIGVLSILMMNIVGAVISAVILWYFFKPHVKDYFGVEVEFST